MTNHTLEGKLNEAEMPKLNHSIQKDELNISSRIRDAIGEESVASFSRRCGIGDSTIRKYLDGALPHAANLVAMADTANVNIAWLAAGRGPKMRGAPSTELQRIEQGFLMHQKGVLSKSLNPNEEWPAGHELKMPGAAQILKVGSSATPIKQHGMTVLDEAHRSDQGLSVAKDRYRSPEISKFLMRVTMASSRATWLPTNMDDEDRMAIANTAVQMLIPVIKDSSAILLGIMSRPAIIDLALRLAFELHTHVIPKT